MARGKEPPKTTAKYRRAHKGADGLTAYQRRFVQEYLIDFVAAAAIRRTGYDGDRADQAGYKMMSAPEVVEAIERGMQEQRARSNLTADMVIAEYRRVAFANMADHVRIDEDGEAYIDLSALTREQAAAISELRVEQADAAVVGGEDGETIVAPRVRRIVIKHHSKLHALDKLGIHTGIFRDDRAPDQPVRFIIEHAPPMTIEGTARVVVTEEK